MRSQATKPLPKKGALNKTILKTGSAIKPAKRKSVSPKKVKSLINKSLVKNPKKSSKDGVAKTDTESSNDSTDSTKINTQKCTASRSESPSKKAKKDIKEKKQTNKITPEANVKKVVAKKINKNPRKPNTVKDKSSNIESQNDDVKYKINVNVAKKSVIKFSKAKNVIKKTNTGNQKRKGSPQKKIILSALDQAEDSNKHEDKHDDINIIEPQKEIQDVTENKKEDKLEQSIEIKNKGEFSKATSYSTGMIQPEPPRLETERPPKFFTSSRSPRMVDIDVKCCKNSKGNLSVSERFLSMKCETKNDDGNKDKTTSNTLVSQGPDIDVYTFTEKVDSPKSILSDFRCPNNKNVGRVRPIARVKGTIIDKKTDLEKIKYSPHRPIEEVVKQLKANKRSEELNSTPSEDNYSSSNLESTTTSSEKEIEDKPQAIVSKSYKMVARKSSITGKPFSPIKFLDQEPSASRSGKNTPVPQKKNAPKAKKHQKKTTVSDDELDTCKFSLNTKTFHYSSSEESVNESNDDNDTKESSESDSPKGKKTKNKKYKKITDGARKTTSKELKELSKDSLIDLKDDIMGDEKPSKRHLKLLNMWSGPKIHRMASLNAIAKVHCLYENESRTHMELGLMKTVDRQILPSTSKASGPKKKDSKPKETEKHESTSESEYEHKPEKKEDSSESSDDNPPQRTLRGVPGIRSAGKYWDPKSSTSSSEDSELDSKKRIPAPEKKKLTSKSSSGKSDTEKPPAKMKKTATAPVKKKRNRNEVVMDLKDMVVQKRMASLNATAILAASYEKRSPKSSKDDTTSDSCSDEYFSQKSKNGGSSGVKSEVKSEDTKKECDESPLPDMKQKVEVIVNQDTDVTITGVYSTHLHEGFCTVSGMQYRISSTSHTQTTATANCEKEGCSRDDGARYTPLSALSSMQPPADHAHNHSVPELGGLTRRAAGCSSAFSAPSSASHHEPGYYQPAGPLIKETGADAERALARYHAPHYHPPHPPMPPVQYGPPYYPGDFCYSRYYRPAGPYHMPQSDAQMVGVGAEAYPPSPYYGAPPCYQHSPQRYVEYRGCPCPLNTCPKNVHIGPATGKAPAGGGPSDAHSALAPPGAAFRHKVRACAIDVTADTHGSGKDPPLEQEPPAAADAPHPCPLPAIGGASPKREMFDVRDNLRLVNDLPGPVEGPPSPARGSAGVCAPQPPPIAPRRARLGKAMARRSLVGEDTALLLGAPLPPSSLTSDGDDDVMALSPPACVPIDLSSSDERATPLVDVKKENEGPTNASSRKTDGQALKEHNSTTNPTEPTDTGGTTKPTKRRYSRPKLEIDMKDTQLEDVCKTNGIGEHVKLQKRRKVSGEQTTILRTESVSKETKKKSLPTTKRTPKTPTAEKRATKRKSELNTNSFRAKKLLLEATVEGDPRLINIAAMPEDLTSSKPKNKSALLLDKLIRKNSIDRPDPKGLSKEINPAELFLNPIENASQTCPKKTNINNNIVEKTPPMRSVRPDTIAAVTQLIEKKLANKNACKLEKVDSKVTNSLKSVLKTPKTDDDSTFNTKCKSNKEKYSANANLDKKYIKSMESFKTEFLKDHDTGVSDEKMSIKDFMPKLAKSKSNLSKTESSEKLSEESHVSNIDNSAAEPKDVSKESSSETHSADKKKRCKLATNWTNGQLKTKSIERVAKLLSKKPAAQIDDNNATPEQTNTSIDNVDKPIDKEKTKKCQANRLKVNGEVKGQSIEKVANLLESNKAKTDDPTIKDTRTAAENDVTKDVTGQLENPTKPERNVGKRCKLTDGELKVKNAEKVVKLLVSKKPAIKVDEATLLVEDACASPMPSVGRRARRRRSAGRRLPRPAPPPPDIEPRAPPKWSNGWTWEGEPYCGRIYLNNDSRDDREARCWFKMTHRSGDSVCRGDCVLLRASAARAPPYVARVASLWENPDDGEMMVSLVWYYRPEHTERGREPADAPDEVFASRHRDANSVACIEDKCYVLTFNEYCRYRKRLKAAEEGICITPSIVPPLPVSEITPAVAPNDSKLPPAVSPELVLFCRKIYDFRSKKIQVPNK